MRKVAKVNLAFIVTIQYLNQISLWCKSILRKRHWTGSWREIIFAFSPQRILLYLVSSCHFCPTNSPQRTLFLVSLSSISPSEALSMLSTMTSLTFLKEFKNFDARKPVELPDFLSVDADPPLPPCLPGKRQTWTKIQSFKENLSSFDLSSNIAHLLLSLLFFLEKTDMNSF